MIHIQIVRLAMAVLLLLLPGTGMAQGDWHVERVPTLKSCWQQTAADYAGSEASRRSRLDEAIETYKPLVEESLVHREVAIGVMERLRAEGKLDEDGVPLTGYDLDRLNSGLMQHLGLRARLYDVAYAQSCWPKAAEWRYEKLGMQPLSEKLRLKGTMLSLSAALILYDNYLLMSSMYEESRKLRRFLNQRDRAYDKEGDALQRLAHSYESGRKRRIVRAAIHYYEQQLKQAPPSWFEDENMAYLNTLIEQSHSYNMVRKSSLLGHIGSHLSFMAMVTEDDIAGLRSEGINMFSGLFGNLMGLVEARKGKLYDKPQVEARVAGRLRAGDILLEKTPFRLTDKLIPGHWGHAAVWIGTEAELKALGIWDDPAVVPFQARIRAGAGVVEALRSGVQLNTLHHFLNVDDLAVLRSTVSTRAARRKRILLALGQIGKAYDFNFDVETTDKIVCSELVYTVYTDLSWPTERALGRYTISPDNVAKKALTDQGLQLITLYHDGKEIPDHPVEAMAQLMKVPANTSRSRVRQSLQHTARVQ